MKLLVIGANGLLGTNVVSVAQRKGLDVAGTYHSTQPEFDIPLQPLDLRNDDQILAVVQEHQPDLTVNCAAITDVDACESNSDAAFQINAEAPEQLATACETSGSQFVHVSTDYVFDGSQRQPYSEEYDPNPKQVYGESKLAGDQAVQQVHPESLIIRPSFIYGVNRSSGTLSGFPAWLWNNLKQNDPVPLFTDQYITPSRAGYTAEALAALAQRDVSGVINVASQECLTPYEFGVQICEVTNSDADLLSEDSLADVDRPAERPQYTCLDTSTVEQLLAQPRPTVEEDLREIVDYFE